MNYRLIIDGHEAELNEQVSVALNKKYESLTDPTGYYVDFSKSVNLPMTRVNNDIMSRIFRCDQVVTNMTIDPRKKVDFVLLHNEELVMRGYMKVTNVYNSGKSKYYQVNLFSELGGLLNDMKQLTYSRNASDAKYIMPNPLSSGLMINRHLVKGSFEQEEHNLDYSTKRDLDHIGFYCEYQGKYPDFESDKMVNSNKITDEFAWVDGKKHKYGERDEHYYHIHRSYYQRPYVWIDSLWQQVKSKIESITDYTINLDQSFFSKNNPYYNNVIYTLPSLYDTSNEVENGNKKDVFGWLDMQYVSHVENQADLSNHHKKILPFNHTSGNRLYNNDSKRWNGGSGFPTHFKENLVWWLFAANPDFQLANGYCRLRDDNPIFITFRAISANNNAYIPGASYTVMLYSNTLPDTSVYYDRAINVGITSRNHPNVVTIPDDTRGKDQGYWWSGELTVEFDVNTTEPFYIIADNYAANNADPFEFALGSWVPQWDWLWTDLYYTTGNMSKGHSVYIRCGSGEVEQTTNIRSNAEITMEKLWRSDKSVFDVLLEYAKMFHLVFDLDAENKVLNVMSRNKYFSDYSIEDWTNKVDRNKDFIVKPINFDKKYLIFGYNDGKGQRMEYYQDRYDANYGERRIDTDIEFNTDEDKLFEKMTPSMICTKKQYSFWDDFVYNITTSSAEKEKILPMEYFPENDADGSSAEMNGQFYFRNGRYDIDPAVSNNGKAYITDDCELEIKNKSYCWHLADGLNVEVTHYPAISTYSADGKYGIQFGEPKELYFNRNMVAYDNPTYIYEGWWKDYIDERWSVQNKVVTAYLYLTAKDYKRYKFNKFITIDNVLYLVNQIYDFDITKNGSTKVDLVQVYDKSKYVKSHLSFPYLYTDKNQLKLSNNITNVDVFSSSSWSVDSIPHWVGYSVSGNALSLYRYSGSILSALSGRITLKNTEGLSYTIDVSSEAQQPYLTLLSRSLTFGSSGESKTIMVSSYPDNISVVSKPRWVSVNVLAMFQNSGLISGNISVMITADANNSNIRRSGSITITNGFNTASVAVTQIGGMVITRPDVDSEIEGITRIDRPLVLNQDTINNIRLDTFKEIDLNTLRITNGNFSKTDASGNDTNKIDVVKYKAVPTKSAKHIADGKTSDGGQIKVNTLDGETIIWNYNIGDTLKKYTVFISAGDGGYITVGGVRYDGAYLEDVADGQVITVSATGNDGHEFTQWSDSNTSNPRTITIHSDVSIEAVYDSAYTERYLAYGDGNNVAFGNNKIISI